MARKRRRGGGGKKSKSRRRKNGFIIYYLSILKCHKNMPVTQVAKMAGCNWRKMSEDEKCKYIKKSRGGRGK